MAQNVCLVSLNSAWSQKERDDRANQKYDKENFGDSGGARRNSTKSKYGGNDRDNQKNGGIVQHKNPPYPSGDNPVVI